MDESTDFYCLRDQYFRFHSSICSRDGAAKDAIFGAFSRNIGEVTGHFFYFFDDSDFQVYLLLVPLVCESADRVD